MIKGSCKELTGKPEVKMKDNGISEIKSNFQYENKNQEIPCLLFCDKCSQFTVYYSLFNLTGFTHTHTHTQEMLHFRVIC